MSEMPSHPTPPYYLDKKSNMQLKDYRPGVDS